MAKENIIKFFDAAMADKSLAEKVATLAMKNGYDFTVEELLKLEVDCPLSDKDAENVQGGRISFRVP